MPEITQNCKKSPKIHKSEIFNFHQFSPNFHPFSPIFTHFHPFSPIFHQFSPISDPPFLRSCTTKLKHMKSAEGTTSLKNHIFFKLRFFPIFSNFHPFFPIFSNFSQFSPIFSNLHTFNFSHVDAHICESTRSARRNACKQICLFRPTPIFTNFHQFSPIFIHFGQFLKGANHFHQFVKGVD